MLNIEEFSESLKEEIEENLGENFYLVKKRVLMNNSCEQTAMMIMKKDGGEDQAAPTYYNELIYEEYLNGVPIEKLALMIITCIGMLKRPEMPDVNNITKEDIEKNLFYRIINAKKNKVLLDNLPHIIFLDLAIIFYYLCNKGSKEISSFKVDDTFADKWGMTADELYTIAQKNTPRIFPEKIDSIFDLVGKMNSMDDDIGYGSKKYCEMYILSNTSGISGAAAMLYSKKMHELATGLDADLYILPSSIHEVILVPFKEKFTVDNLLELVKDINKNVLKPEDVLSDNVYYYARETKRIMSCS